MLIKACLNGSRNPEEHRALPLSPAALAKDAEECRKAGAGGVHIHPRGMGGRETLEPDACAAAIEAIRNRCPGLPVGLSTGLWITGSSARRLSLIESWTVLPDFCSVNFAEDGTSELCQLLVDRGITIEAGLTSVADARAFVDSGYVDHCLRVLIEVEPGLADPLRGAIVIGRVLEGAGVRLPRLQHGMGPAAWPLLEDAVARGYDVRIGLEDVLTMPDGSPAPGNAALVAAAVQLAATVTARR
ncbi:MAG TPA: 3-keto-5-aminohexanoate cleavage protein [Candidatus Dormibacteraeota bacterium]|nr:3-keto-5-aminohexanoate cleavage protein [Candidatus Dormibacteraeota bacterium]